MISIRFDHIKSNFLRRTILIPFAIIALILVFIVPIYEAIVEYVNSFIAGMRALHQKSGEDMKNES